VRRFLNNLASERNVAASTQNQAFSALLFLYKEVLKQQLPWMDDIQCAKRPAKMPLGFHADGSARSAWQNAWNRTSNGADALRLRAKVERVRAVAREGH